ncbi:MAG: type I methionyl aminopeptidase [Acidobacteriota bacterium]
MIFLKSKKEIEIMNRANKIVLKVLDVLEESIKPGMKTKELDEISEEITIKEGGIPAFKNYHGYPASLCVSVNDEVVHGIPSEKKLKEGDIVSLDFGVLYQGYYGDAARTCPVGKIAEEDEKLISVTKESLSLGIKEAREGAKVSDISTAVQNYVEKNGFSVVRDYVGHGIGKNLHEEPQVPNFFAEKPTYPIKCGMVLAIEPMVNAGKSDVVVEKDGWTVRTKDGKKSAHFEYSVAVTENGPVILGVSDL